MGDKADRKLGNIADWAFGTPIAADPTAPTVAEVNALTRIECDIVGSDTIETPRTGSGVRIEGLCDLESSEIAGLITNGPIVGQGFRHFDGTDGFYVLMDDTTDPTPTQTLIGCRAGFSGAAGIAAAGDVVDVFEVQVSARNAIGPRQNDAQMFGFELRVLRAEYNVTVAA